MDKDKVQSVRWLILILMGVAVIITALQNTMTNVGLPALQAEFGADNSMSQWFLNSYIVTFAALLLLMGSLGDRYGRKLLLNLGLLTFAAGSIWATVASSGNEFIVSQVIMGAGAAMLTPQTLSILVDVFKKKERALAIAIWTGLAAMGVGLGPLVGGILLENYDVNSLFYVNLPLVAIVLIAGWFLVPESKKAVSGHVDVVGTVLSFMAVFALLVGFIWVPEHGWLGLYTLGAFLVSAVTASMFVAYEKTIKNPLLDMKYFKNRDFVDGIIGTGIIFFNLMGLLFLVTQFLQIVQQKSALDTGLLLIPMAVTIALASIVGQKLATRVGQRKMIVYGVAIATVGMLLVGLWQSTSSEWVVAITLSIVGLGAGLTLAPATNSIMSAFTEKNAGMGSSVSTLARQVFGAIGIALLGSVLSSRYSDYLANYVSGAPEDIAQRITGSIQGAYELAAEFAAQGQQVIANSVVASVNSAFMVALSAAMVVAVIITLLVAALIHRSIEKN